MSGSDLDTLKTGITLIGVGCLFFFKGFRNYWVRRKVEDIPTSKISSGALGSFVEVVGKIAGSGDGNFKSPLTGRNCISYIWSLEEKMSSKDEWLVRSIYYSSPFIYITDDGKNYAAIDLACCDFQGQQVEKEVRFDNLSFKLPEKVKEILHANDMMNFKRGSFFSNEYRLRESVLQESQLLYVLGTAIQNPVEETSLSESKILKFGKLNKKIQKKVDEYFDLAVGDPEIYEEFNKDKNSVLCSREQENLYNAVKASVLLDYRIFNTDQFRDKTRMCFTRSKNNIKYFYTGNVIVSFGSEKKILKELTSKSFKYVVGGPLMVLLGVGVFYYYW